MFFPMIATIVILLIIVGVMSSSPILAENYDLQMRFGKIKNTYRIEQAIVNSVEAFCQLDPDTCLENENDGIIDLTVGDLSGYISSNFVNDNLFGGYYTIKVVDNYSTIRLLTAIPNNYDRSLYLHHYLANATGIPTLCSSGSETSVPACDDSGVFHDFPTSLNFRAALN